MSDRNGDRDIGFFVSPEHASIVLLQCADVTISLDENLRVERFFCTFDFDASKLRQWVGKRFQQIVAKDSQSKLEHLFADNCASSVGDARWRHLNLRVDGKPRLPLLLKYFCFDDKHGVTQLICARDLRPIIGMQERFQREVDLMGQENSKLEQKLKFIQ